MYLITIVVCFGLNGNGIRRILNNGYQCSANVGSSANEVVLNCSLPVYVPEGAYSIPYTLFQNSGVALQTDIDVYITMFA